MQLSKSSDKQPIVVFFSAKSETFTRQSGRYTRMKALTSGVNFCRCEKVKLTDEYSKVMYFVSVTEKPKLDFCV